MSWWRTAATGFVWSWFVCWKMSMAPGIHLRIHCNFSKDVLTRAFKTYSCVSTRIATVTVRAKSSPTWIIDRLEPVGKTGVITAQFIPMAGTTKTAKGAQAQTGTGLSVNSKLSEPLSSVPSPRHCGSCWDRDDSRKQSVHRSPLQTQECWDSSVMWLLYISHFTMRETFAIFHLVVLCVFTRGCFLSQNVCTFWENPDVGILHAPLKRRASLYFFLLCERKQGSSLIYHRRHCLCTGRTSVKIIGFDLDVSSAGGAQTVIMCTLEMLSMEWTADMVCF